jgi:hypothetical protein
MQRRSGRPGAATELTVSGAWSLAIGRSPMRSPAAGRPGGESDSAERGGRTLQIGRLRKSESQAGVPPGGLLLPALVLAVEQGRS